MHEVHTEIEIEAEQRAVWSVLTDLPRFSEWNPYFQSARGRVEQNEGIAMRVNAPGARAATLHGRVVSCRPSHLLKWQGTIAFPAMVRLEQEFRIHELDRRRVLLAHRSVVSGPLCWIEAERVMQRTRSGCNAMNRALKLRVEAR
jgi:hypothetical protein